MFITMFTFQTSIQYLFASFWGSCHHKHSSSTLIQPSNVTHLILILLHVQTQKHSYLWKSKHQIFMVHFCSEHGALIVFTFQQCSFARINICLPFKWPVSISNTRHLCANRLQRDLFPFILIFVQALIFVETSVQIHAMNSILWPNIPFNLNTFWPIS